MKRVAIRAGHAAVLAAGLLAATLCGCTDLDLKPLPTVGSEAGDQAVAQPSLRNDVQPIFTARCAVVGCHITATEANFGLVLTDPETSRRNIVNVPSGLYPPFTRVVPGDSSMSILPTMLITGEMPKQGPPLSQPTIDTIRNWIDQGAQDN
jgi:hypothetical protein